MVARSEMLIIQQNNLRKERLTGERQQREEVASRAELLPEADRTFLLAHFDRGMSVRELAQIHGTTERQTRRRLERLCAMLKDRSFVLVGRYGRRLPEPLRILARRYWFEGACLRTLARERGQSLYRVRQEIESIRSMLVGFAARAERPTREKPEGQEEWAEEEA